MENIYYINKKTLGLYILNEATKDMYPQELIDTLTPITKDQYISILDNCGKKDIVFLENGIIDVVDKPLPNLKNIEKLYSKEVSKSLDKFAQQKGYDNIISACSYAASDVLKFSTEAKTCIGKRDVTWNKFYELFSLYELSSDVPSIDKFLLLLPELVWED